MLADVSCYKPFFPYQDPIEHLVPFPLPRIAALAYRIGNEKCIQGADEILIHIGQRMDDKVYLGIGQRLTHVFGV